MIRVDIVNDIGREYLQANTESGEFSYSQALRLHNKNYLDYMLPDARRNYKDIDLRFVDGNLTILIETKKTLISSNSEKDMEQLQQYVIFEKELTGNKIVAMLVSTLNGEIRVWQDGSDIISDEHEDKNERIIKSMSEYKNLHFGTRNDKIAVVQSTYQLNILLHNHGIKEKIRSQFVGTCLLALKNGLNYEKLSTKQIIAGIEEILSNLLDDDLRKNEKLVILKNKVLESQDVRDLKQKDFEVILKEIEKKILPYINEKSTMGQDLLNLFFTTFNKYVGKSDKNQAFTPDHIVHFMCKVVGINRKSVVLDPCCGSGAFLVRAMTEAMDDCDTDEQRDNVKKKQIHGYEYEETAFGLSTTNMLIHGDGNSNIKQASCFEELPHLEANVDVVLMNPPFNAQRKHSDPGYVKQWKDSVKEDPSKGFHFVYEVAKKVGKGKVAVLLPMQCAIGASTEIKRFKKKMLEEHTLDAVFSLPSDIFHPGASAVACCMIFNLGTRHEKSQIKETFFGYYKDDGYEKRKNVGRMEREEGLWRSIENKWLNLYFNRETEKGVSINKEVTSNDEWLAEAWMETDYTTLNPNDFQQVLNEYLGYLVANGKL
ncbi:HsdM family class I SAM-dependent methyltransferase [Psychrobacter celer]|uniref:HsdM family class I SAM-dependent methyltransferase n=1 Tax=Psychrobacter celer TaxID=306572 RepID=UPI003FD0A69B